jgi:hypothetical protein
MTPTHMEVDRRDDNFEAQELELISQYVCHEMSPAEEQAFERRLTDDGAFFDRAMPILNTWYSDELTDALAAAPAPVPVVVTRRASVEKVLGTRGRWVGLGGALATAAGIAFAMLQQVAVVAPTPSPILTSRTPDKPDTPAVAVTHPVRAPKHDATIRSAQRQLDALMARVVAANNDTTAARVIGEPARSGPTDPLFASSRVAPVEDSVHLTVSPMPVPVLGPEPAPIDSAKPGTIITDPLHPDTPADGATKGGGLAGWLRGLIGKVMPQTRGGASHPGPSGKH